MPLVQFALTQLWHERDASRRLVTRAGLRAIGGVAGALERHAETTVARIEALGAGALEAAREALLSLTTPEGTRALRAPLELTERLRGRHAEAVLAELESARLAVREAAGLTLAHEALLSQWGRLRRWLEDAASDRVLEGEIERDAARWSAQRDPTLLWKKRRLSAAADLRARDASRLSSQASAFVRAARAEEFRGRALAGVLGLAIVLAAAAGFALYVVQIEAEKRQKDQALAAAQASERRATQAAAEAERARSDAARAEAEAGAARDGYRKDLADLRREIERATTLKALREAAIRVDSRRKGDGLPQPGAPPASSRPPALQQTGDPP